MYQNLHIWLRGTIQIADQPREREIEQALLRPKNARGSILSVDTVRSARTQRVGNQKRSAGT